MRLHRFWARGRLDQANRHLRRATSLNIAADSRAGLFRAYCSPLFDKRERPKESVYASC